MTREEELKKLIEEKRNQYSKKDIFRQLKNMGYKEKEISRAYHFSSFVSKPYSQDLSYNKNNSKPTYTIKNPFEEKTYTKEQLNGMGNLENETKTFFSKHKTLIISLFILSFIIPGLVFLIFFIALVYFLTKLNKIEKN